MDCEETQREHRLRFLGRVSRIVDERLVRVVMKMNTEEKEDRRKDG